MNNRDNRLPDRVRTISRFLSGRHQPSRGVQLLLLVLGRIFEHSGGKVTGKAIFATLIVLGVVVLVFVAYRLAVLVLTTYADGESIDAALRAGARGYLTKDAGRVEIANALRAAGAGQAVFDPAVARRLVEALDRPAGPGPVGSRRVLPDGLTVREAEVLGLIARGLSNAEIGTALFVAPTTVKTHVNHVFTKIGVRNRTEAAAYANRHGLTTHP